MPVQLDDLKYIHHIDTSDALGLASKQWQQLEHDFVIDPSSISGEIQNIVHSGMGGSALWALLSMAWPSYTVPFEVVREYDIPTYVNTKTLFIASSYSGNTEETLSSLAQAEKQGAQIAIITSGGKLLDIAREKKYALVELPDISKPSFGCLYGFKALIMLAEKLRVVAEGSAAELATTAMFLGRSVAEWQVDIPLSQNPAKQLAMDIAGTSPVMYAGPLLKTAAHKWKISFNENAKNVAWEYSFPEFNHNEFTGWTSHPVEKPYGIVYLQSSFDNGRIKKRFDLSDKLLSGRWPSPHRVEAKGATKLQQLLWMIALGDFVSLYTAFLNGINPIETGDNDITKKLKYELGTLS